jgi:hypothetical protein
MRLFPNTSSTDIEIEIFYANRSADPVYEALSYVCGPPEPVGILFVREEKLRLSKLRRAFHIKRKQHSEDLATLPITRNLSTALRHLQCWDDVRVLWYAICIHRQDLAERSAEVIKMGMIYKALHKPLFGLPRTENSGLAVQTLENIGKGLIILHERAHIKRKRGAWDNRFYEREEMWSMYKDSWMAIGELLRRRWFFRLWSSRRLD